MDLVTSLKYAGGAALTGGAASAANVVFGVSVIGLLVFQVARSTWLGAGEVGLRAQVFGEKMFYDCTSC